MIIRQPVLDFGEEELDSDIILIDDPRWKLSLEEFKSAKVFCNDIETYGEGEDEKEEDAALNPRLGHIRLIQVGLLSGKVLIANLGGWWEDRKELKEKHKDFLEIFLAKIADPQVIKIGQNLKYEMGWYLNKYNTPMRNIRDLMLMSQVYWAGIKKYRHGLGYILERLGFYADKTEQMSDWGSDLTHSQLNYAARDVKLFEPVKKLKEMLVNENLWETALIECNACRAFAEIEYYGLPIDLEYLERVYSQYAKQHKKAIQPFLEAFPGVNPDSHVQVNDALNERYKLGLEGSNPHLKGLAKKEDDKRRQKLNSKIMSSCDELPVKALLLYRSLGTQVHYLEGLKKLQVNSRIHPKFFQIAANEDGEGMGMGRTSSKSPNVQNPSNPPKQWLKLGLPSVREVFRAPNGYKYLVSDLSQAHMRIATEVSQDNTLVTAYNSGWDLHSVTASQLAKIKGLGPDWTHENISKWRNDKTHPNSKLADDIRKVSKTVNYAGLNGSGAMTIMQNAASSKKDPIFAPLEEWQATVTAFRETYAGLEQFKRRIYEHANSFNTRFDDKIFGEIRGLSGRRLFVEKIRTDNGFKSKYTDTVSHIWMSTEADIGKRSLADFVEERDKKGWDAYIINFPHDEINVIAREDQAEEVAKALLDIMDRNMHLYITSIPVNDNSDYKSLVKDTWAEK